MSTVRDSKICVLNTVVDTDTLAMFHAHGYNNAVWSGFENPQRYDLLVLVGGVDVHPLTYGHCPEKGVKYDVRRDMTEFTAVGKAAEAGVPVLGICRGSQLLCIANDGNLIQDVKGHALRGYHMARGFNKQGEGVELMINSTHHQVADPNPEEGVVLLWGDCGSDHGNFNYRGEKERVVRKREPEAVYYPRHRQLGIQYHPEWMEKDSDGRKVAMNLVEDLLTLRTPNIRI